MNTVRDSFVSMFLLCLFVLWSFNSCVSTTAPTSQKYDTQTLVDMWLGTNSQQTRKSIIDKLEKQQDLKGLIGCLENVIYLHAKTKNSTVKAPLIRPHDILPIIKAIGRFKNPDTIEDLEKLKIFTNKKIQLGLLEAFEQINDPESANIVALYLKNSSNDVRMKALNILISMKTVDSSDAVISILFDEDPLIRWKAVHALGEMYNPKSVDKISLLLTDNDESVRNSAEQVLRKIGVPQERIILWKEKAKEMSLDDVYRTRLAYEKAVSEKTELQEKVNTLEKVKSQLEGALKGHAHAIKAKEHILSSLYEKEQQLLSKNKQFELSSKQSEDYLKQLEILNTKYLELNRQINKNKQDDTANNLKDELNETIIEKENFEKEIQISKGKETVLKKEISELEKLSENARIKARNAQQQVEKMVAREVFLLKEMDNLRKHSQMGMKPVVLISGPEDNTSVKVPYALLHVFAVDDKGIEDIIVTLNDAPVELDITRGIKTVNDKKRKNSQKIQFKQRLKLTHGQNTIKVKATDINGISTEETITITRQIERGQIFAAIIGINEYQSVRHLKYAVNDAKAFKNYLKYNIGVPEKNLFYLTDKQASKRNLQKILGTHLKRSASKEDTVFIFFAGHGAVESDPGNPDGDGFEKYLLPYDADLNDLYTSSISMDEIRKIFQRIRSERIIFIADSCYSGASGGRTILTSSSRANLSDNFLERISKGKGRIIISSCAANEVSQEDDNFKHGLFTYYLLKGLRSEADFDNDGLISVGEIFGYVSKTVPSASGQNQHPVKRGDLEGQFFIGRVK
ncbi:MAG: caspase family protein [Desulfobacula sp.]|nr:caspase family protein [Desulfobacula sp.]